MALLENTSTKKKGAHDQVYTMTGTVVMIVQKIPSSKSLKEVKKSGHQENVTSKKMSTKSSVYYDGYGSYDFPKICLPKKPL